MTSAPTLFDHPARATDPSTSHDAARLDRSTLTAQVRRILKAYPDGLTDDQLWTKTGVSASRHGSVVKARLHAGAVASGRYGRSQTGSKATIWVLPEAQS